MTVVQTVAFHDELCTVELIGWLVANLLKKNKTLHIVIISPIYQAEITVAYLHHK